MIGGIAEKQEVPLTDKRLIGVPLPDKVDRWTDASPETVAKIVGGLAGGSVPSSCHAWPSRSMADFASADQSPAPSCSMPTPRSFGPPGTGVCSRQLNRRDAVPDVMSVSAPLPHNWHTGCAVSAKEWPRNHWNPVPTEKAQLTLMRAAHLAPAIRQRKRNPFSNPPPAIVATMVMAATVLLATGLPAAAVSPNPEETAATAQPSAAPAATAAATEGAQAPTGEAGGGAQYLVQFAREPMLNLRRRPSGPKTSASDGHSLMPCAAQ
ncbi:histidine triad [Arthrobacter sp. Hiyo4]|nr:histidine triad [Arthrobacter sp. Hiyo4]